MGPVLNFGCLLEVINGGCSAFWVPSYRGCSEFWVPSYAVVLDFWCLHMGAVLNFGCLLEVIIYDQCKWWLFWFSVPS